MRTMSKEGQMKEMDGREQSALIAAYDAQWKTAQSLAVDYEKQAYILFAVGASLLSLAYGVLAGQNATDRSRVVFLLLILLTGSFIMIAWISTLLRRQALAENNAIRIEKRLNELLGEDVYLWQSQYMERYGADPRGVGLPNRLIQISCWVFVAVLTVWCLWKIFGLLIVSPTVSDWIKTIFSIALFALSALYAIIFLRMIIRSFENRWIRSGDWKKNFSGNNSTKKKQSKNKNQ